MLTIFWCDQIPERFPTSNKYYYEDNKKKGKTAEWFVFSQVGNQNLC